MSGTATDTRKTGFLPRGTGPFLRRQARWALGLALMLAGLMALLALVSHHPGDPSLNTAADGQARNLLGRPGAYLADVAMQAFGMAAMLGALVVAVWGWRVVAGDGITAAWLRVCLLAPALAFIAAALAVLPAPADWSLDGGLGGAAGMLLLGHGGALALALGLTDGPAFLGLVFAAIGLALLVPALGMNRREWRAIGGGLRRLMGGTSAAAGALASAGQRLEVGRASWRGRG